MADSSTVLGLNYVKVPSGTTAERPVSPAIGYLWYNTTIGYMEYYGASGWSAIAAPPTIATATPTTFNGESGTLITINGSNFDSGAAVAFILPNGNPLNPGVTTRVSSSQLTATIPRDILASESPLDVRVTNGSGLSAILENVLNCADVPVFNTASGSIGTLYDSGRSSVGILSTLTATDANGGSITSYAIVSGALPPGISINSSTAALSGTANAVGSDTTYSFTVRATDNAGNTTDRAFSILVRAPVVQSYTSGSGTFSVPLGVSSVRVLVVAGGASGGTANSGSSGGGTDGGAGGGAGGMIDVPSFPVSPGGSVSYSVGGGGQLNNGGERQGYDGGNSTFGSLTAIGGGGGGAGPGGPVADGRPGGSGGGRGGGGSPNTGVTGNGVQPSQPGLSGSFGYGNRGGFNPNQAGYSGAGGGGAAGVGADGGLGRSAPGGAARNSDITGSNTAYAGGGGGGSGSQANNQGAGGGAGAGAGNPYGSQGQPASGNAGSGGGGGPGGGAGVGGSGAPGCVIVRY